MIEAKIEGVKGVVKFPLLATDRATRTALYLVTHENDQHKGVWCGVCIAPGRSGLFKPGDKSSDLSSPNLVEVKTARLSNGLE